MQSGSASPFLTTAALIISPHPQQKLKFFFVQKKGDDERKKKLSHFSVGRLVIRNEIEKFLTSKIGKVITLGTCPVRTKEKEKKCLD